MEVAMFRRDDETFERERQKYASASRIMKDKVVIKEGKEGMRARALRMQGESYVNLKTANEEMINTWNLNTVPADAFHKVTEDEIKDQMRESQRQLSMDLDNLKKDRKSIIREMIIKISLAFVFILLCYGLTAGILKLDELVVLNFSNIYIVYGGYALIHAGLPILIFRLLRVAEGITMEHYIRIWHQLIFMGASLVAGLLMLKYMGATIIGIVVWGICQLAVILLTLFPKYQD